MEIQVSKYTDIEAMRRWCSASTGKESKMALAKGYALGHSFVRSQRFYITLKGIPQFVASQLVRHKVGVEWVMKSKRTDRGGEDFKEACSELRYDIESFLTEWEEGEELDAMQGYKVSGALEELDSFPRRFDRNAPTDLFADIDAEAIINISRARLCAAASEETRQVWQQVINKVAEVDPALAKHCVPPCIATGICREKRCSLIHSELYSKLRAGYLQLFV